MCGLCVVVWLCGWVCGCVRVGLVVCAVSVVGLCVSGCGVRVGVFDWLFVCGCVWLCVGWAVWGVCLSVCVCVGLVGWLVVGLFDCSCVR